MLTDLTLPAPELTSLTFWTVGEVATLARVSRMTIYRLVRSGELESVRVGRSFRIPEYSVRTYLGLPDPAQEARP
jgi:excisionase family DNA binding protein